MGLQIGFAPYPKGTVTASAKVNPSNYGMVYMVKNMQVDEQTQPPDGRMTMVRLVKNASGSAITPGTPVKFKTGGLGYLIAGETGAESADGFSDPHVTTIANGEWFLMAISGPTKAQKAAGTITLGDQLSTVASGQVQKITAATPTVLQLSLMCGKAEETSSAAANTLIKIDVRNLI
jgi:hypothetical protein